MSGGNQFWVLFGSIWLVVGVCFVAVSLGVNLFADPAMLNKDLPLWLFFLLGLVCAGAGRAIIYFARKASTRDRRLMQSGVQLTATVIDIRRSIVDINRQTRWHVVYRYEYTKGRPLECKSRALPGEAVWAFKPGDNVLIKVDPQQPEEPVCWRGVKVAAPSVLCTRGVNFKCSVIAVGALGREFDTDRQRCGGGPAPPTRPRGGL